MRLHRVHVFAISLLFASVAAPLAAMLAAQPPTKVKAAKKSAESDSTPNIKVAKPSPFFQSEMPVAITFTTNLKQLRKDKGETSPWHAATVAMVDSAGKSVVVPVTAKTRGIWRLKNCEFPPVRWKFSKANTKGTIFHELHEPKLVSYCRNSDAYEQYILQEYMLYRVYRLLTPASHQARLMRVTYVDSASGKVDATRYGFLLEDPAQVAARLGGRIVKTKGAGPEDLDTELQTLTFLFEYMIGNTDFSFAGLHNTELIQKSNGDLLPIVFDFDYSGAVDASYATSDPHMRSVHVRDRQFRGYCSNKTEYSKAIDVFKEKKDAIYALYADDVGRLLQPRTVKATLSYFDEFYRDLATPKDFERRVMSDCLATH